MPVSAIEGREHLRGGDPNYKKGVSKKAETPFLLPLVTGQLHSADDAPILWLRYSRYSVWHPM
jgi:hypothetical protein